MHVESSVVGALQCNLLCLRSSGNIKNLKDKKEYWSQNVCMCVSDFPSANEEFRCRWHPCTYMTEPFSQEQLKEKTLDNDNTTNGTRMLTTLLPLIPVVKN